MEVLELQPDTKLKTFEHFSLSEIDRREGHEIDYNEFYWNYMNANVPIVLTSIGNDWECNRNWLAVKNDQNDGSNTKSTINFNYLRNLTNENVPVADCSKEYYNSHVKLEMPFQDFLIYWSTSISEDKGAEENSNIGQTTQLSKNLYLKDWHLKSIMPNYDFYCVPKQFASDWLNEFLIGTARDDYRFVYMGPKGSWTPFHADVFGSFSWSTNIFGCKKWLLMPPGEESKLMEKKQLPFAINEQLLNEKNVNFITLYQKENEALFVPSGWYHQVNNLTDTISINHNFFNACNLKNIWKNLSINMRQVIAEIEDCRQMENFDAHCQTMLRASFGINYLDFLDMLEFITKRRLAYTSENNNKIDSGLVLFDKYKLNNFHIHHDLVNLRLVLETMIDDTVICDNRALLYRRCITLLEMIKHIAPK